MKSFEDYRYDFDVGILEGDTFKKKSREWIAQECVRRLKMAKQIFEDYEDYITAIDERLQTVRNQRDEALLEVQKSSNYKKLGDALVEFLKSEGSLLTEENLGDAMDNVDYERKSAEARAWT